MGDCNGVEQELQEQRILGAFGLEIKTKDVRD